MRLNTLDILKGIGIILVVVGHMIADQLNVRPWIYMFHMPLFFLISGYCFDVTKYPVFKSFIKKRWQQILLPCILYSVIYFIYDCTQGHGFEIFYEGIPGGHLWFLTALFVVELMCYKMLTGGGKNACYIYLLLSCLVAEVLNDLQLPMNYRLIHLPMCLFFYVIGNLLRESQLVLRLLKNGMEHKFYSVLTGVFLIASSYFYACIAHPHWTDILSFFDVWMQTACFMAIAGLMFMSKVIEKSVIGRVLMYLGKNTMIIFAIHVIIISLCSTYLKPVISNFTLYKSLSFILVFGISIGIVPLVNRYLPVLAGKGESR